jgi:hypothetical protein
MYEETGVIETNIDVQPTGKTEQKVNEKNVYLPMVIPSQECLCRMPSYTDEQNGSERTRERKQKKEACGQGCHNHKPARNHTCQCSK